MKSSNNSETIRATIIDIENQRIDNHNKVLFECLCGTFSCLFVIALICGIITLVVFDIFALTTYSNLNVVQKCEKSNLWSYVFWSLALIFADVIHTAINKNKYNIVDSTGYSICTGLISTGMLFWGNVEMDIYCTYKLDNTSIYKMAFIHLILNYITVGILFIVALANVYIKMYKT
jgi:hypothetical protein